MPTNGMSNFKRMVERLALGGKLLTTQEKLATMAKQLRNGESLNASATALRRFPQVGSVKPVK